MDARDNIATDLFYKIRSRFSGLKLGAETGEITINPESARFFDFDYMEGETPIGHVSISLAEPNSMKVYFSHGITETMDTVQKNNWYGFLKELRMFAKRRLLNFDTRDIAKDNLDQRDYEFLSQNAQPKQTVPNTIQQPVGESIMSESQLYGTKTVSYQKLMDTRLIIKHSQALTDDMAPGARSRHISGLFVENADGERFKYPFIHLAGARAMQRHVANGGVPYDDLGKSIINMSEQIAQLKSFGNYVVRNDLMNSDTNGIVERSSQQLNSMREQIKALSKQGHYENYKANFQAQAPLEVPQDVIEDFTEKFTVKNFKEDIKSVFPVLYRLMQEDNTVGYDDIVAMTKQIQPTEELTVENTVDPFYEFESWVMELGETSAITSQDPDEQQAAVQRLQELLADRFPAGVDGSNAIQSLQGIIEDPQLFQAIKAQSKEDPDSCVGELVKNWIEQNAPDVATQLDFGNIESHEMDEADYDPSYDPDYRPYQKPEPDPDSWKQDRDMEEPSSPTTVSIVDSESGEVIDTFPSTGGFYGDLRKSAELGYDTEAPDATVRLKWNKNKTENTEQSSDKMNVQELAEFINSFYDKETNTFPKGPEGVCTMVGKKFGEQAENVARKFVERMAPHQSSSHNPELAELSRIKELSGVKQVDELSPGTLSSYATKAVDPSSEKSAPNLASRAASKLAADGEDDGDADDRKAYNRSTGVSRAISRLAKLAGR